MENFKFKLQNAEINFEFEMDNIQEQDKNLIEKLLSMIDRKAGTSYEQFNKDGLENKDGSEDELSEIKKGYNLFSNNIEGFHEGTDEFIAKKTATEILNNADLVDPAELREKRNSQPSSYKESFDTSIRISKDNTNLYQTYYVCPKCKNRGKRYIPQNSIFTYCHSCLYKMKVYPASLKGFPNKDKFGNFFIAGDYKPESTNDEDN